MAEAVLADTSFWIALRHVRDAHHARANELAAQLLRERSRFVVTLLIFAEAYAFFLRSVPLRERIIRDFWENPVIELVEITASDQQEALALLRRHQDKSYSFCDACSFVVMERLGLRRCVAFDQHFRQFGAFDVLR